MQRDHQLSYPYVGTGQLGDDTGSAGAETAIAVTALLLVLFFLVGAMRVVGTNGEVSSAARAGARAAATARTPADAASRAGAVISSALAARGVACAGGPRVAVQVTDGPGQPVTVAVTCTVSLGDVVIAGFPGSSTVHVSATEYVDQIRGEQ